VGPGTMRRITAEEATGVEKAKLRFIPNSNPVTSYAGIPVFLAENALVGMRDGEVVFFVEYGVVKVPLQGVYRKANRVLRAWRNETLPETADFLLPLYVPFILEPYGIALSAGTYTPASEALSKKIVALVPHAYAWDNGEISVLGEWGTSAQILFSMEALL